MISKKCRVCSGIKLKKVFSLNNQPLANNLEKKFVKSKKFPLALNLCLDCYNCQLSFTVPSKILFKNYLYKSSISQSFKKHFEKACDYYVKFFKLNQRSYILDIGSNDGIALIPFKKKKFKNLYGIEPAKKLAKITKLLGIRTFTQFLNNKIADKNLDKFDLILASNVFAHVNDLKTFTICVDKMLKKDGVFIIEVQYLLNMLREYTFDNIYHEHMNYWSVYALRNFLSQFNLEIFDVKKIKTHGGSIRVFVKKKENKKIMIKNSFYKFLLDEKKFKINTIKPYSRFLKKVLMKKIRFIKLIQQISHKNIVGYGAPAKATTLINYYKISKFIKYIIDENPLKNNKYIPNSNIQILNKPKSEKIDYMLVFAWNYF
uniref:class I SAM-dependent methyltransferase n=1 Tax=Candidatus Pelagibacter sp. HIMB1521 TaxID=3413344 RepID=UPI003F836478